MSFSVLSYCEATFARFGGKVAFEDEKEQITFSQVDQYTQGVGTFLSHHAKPQEAVVVMSGRHVLTPCAFLGVVRAGCYYVPMDATMPVLRLQQILEVIQAKWMIVDRQNLAAAEKLGFTGTIFVLEDILHTQPEPELLQSRYLGLNENTPLYVIFTSGSSGKPKGVITSHHSLMVYIDAVCRVLQITEKDVLGNQSPLDYIAAIRDIYLPMKTGATTVIIPKSEFAMPTKLFETLNRSRVTTLCWSVAGLELPAKLGAFDCIRPQYLKKVIFSGSVMPCKYLRIWQQNLPDTMFVNQYGPTEATASCTYYVVPHLVEETDVLPIGQPYENYTVFLLNEDNTATEDGKTGEICVAGPGLALGYYGDPERTQASFVQNPLNGNYRELIYKTGDLGRRREDGLLEFHGRKDRQVKHMGHRIELGEIELTAGQIEGVTGCCALYDHDKEQLCLFYTGDAQPREITVYFRQHLPAFMAPRKFVNLAALPTLPNGKLDIRSLQLYLKK